MHFRDSRLPTSLICPVGRPDEVLGEPASMEVLTEFGRRLGASGTFDTLNLPYCAPRDKRFCVDDDEISGVAVCSTLGSTSTLKSES